MQKHLRRQLSLAALACLCVLLVNCAATRAENEPANKEPPTLAKNLLSEGDEASLPAEKSHSKKGQPPAAEWSLDAQKGAEAPKELLAKAEADSKQSVVSTGSAVKPIDASEAAPGAAPQQATSQEVGKELKDLKSLLENKNDAENDLGPSPIASGAPLNEPKADQPPPAMKGQFASEPRPDADKPLDERFHYSIGAEKPLEGKKEEPASAEQRPKAGESAKEAAAAPADEQPEEPAKKEAGETEEEEKESESEPSSTSPKASETSTTTTTQPPSSTTSTEKPVVLITKLDEEKPSTTTTTTTTTTTAPPPVDSAQKPAVKDSELGSSDKTPSVASTEAANKDLNGASTTASEASSDVTTSSSRPLAPKSDVQEKPTVANSVSSIATAAAAAAGSSLGSAVGSAIGSSIAGKERPSEAKPVAAASAPLPNFNPSTSATTSSTTRAPASRRKSTTDRWNRPPSTSEAPPTRRRPVLPSIRRRFRPYNRFSPFPWAPSGPEVYSPGQPYDTPLNAADAEPDFGRPLSFDKSTRPPRRRSTTELPAWKSSSAAARPKSSTSESGDEDELSPSVLTRRQPAESSASGAGRRQHIPTNRFPDNDWSQPGGRMPDPFESSHPSDSDRHRPPHRRHNKHHHRQRHDERPYLGEPTLLNGARPQSPTFGLFNSAGSSSTGSAFDILNPFSWVDEITKPLRPSYHHNRPGFESGRPGGPHSGPAARPSGPIPVEGEYNGAARPGAFEDGVGEHPQRPGHHEQDHHHDHHHHRPHRPVGSGGRDDYYDDHHHDCHHEHEHEHDHHHDQSRPHRPTRPDGYEDYGGGASNAGRRPLGGGGLRPDRPYYNRRDQPTTASGSSSSEHGGSGSSSHGGPSASNSNTGDSTIVRDNETLNSSGERLANRGSERQVGGSPSLRRVPVFSPFDSLFGTLDDELFGGLRSSFVDAPMKASGELVSQFDAVVNSPKISLPAGPAHAAPPDQSDRMSGGQSGALSSRSTGAESAPKVAEERVKPVDKREPKANSADSPADINRGGIRHFLLMI